MCLFVGEPSFGCFKWQPKVKPPVSGSPKKRFRSVSQCTMPLTYPASSKEIPYSDINWKARHTYPGRGQRLRTLSTASHSENGRPAFCKNQACLSKDVPRTPTSPLHPKPPNPTETFWPAKVLNPHPPPPTRTASPCRPFGGQRP